MPHLKHPNYNNAIIAYDHNNAKCKNTDFEMLAPLRKNNHDLICTTITVRISYNERALP
jgi:hypothetical protein